MKKMFIVPMFIAFVVICSCPKQDSAAEAQLAQRKTELDAREDTLIQREKAVEEREKAVAEREKAVATSRIIQSQRQAPDAAQAEAERQRRIQQLPPELRALIPDRSQIEAARGGEKQERPTQRQLGPDDLQRQWQRKLESDKAKARVSGAIASPDAAVPEPETTSPYASPTPQ